MSTALYVVSALVAGVAALALAVAAARARQHSRPKGYTPPRTAADGGGKAGADCTREAFREKKLPPEVEYVVVGSGMGSLYCAALLAKAGKRVVVLEQHYVAGGCTHSWHDKVTTRLVCVFRSRRQSGTLGSGKLPRHALM